MLQGKFCATLVTGLNPYITESVSKSMAVELRDYESMNLVGQLNVQGNLPSLTCGDGDFCKMSAVKIMYGPDVRTEDFEYQRADEQKNICAATASIGSVLGEKINGRKTG